MLRNLLRSLRRPRVTEVRAAEPPAGLPSDLTSVLTFVISLQRAGEHAQAEAACRALLERTPGDLNALHLLGASLLAQDKTGEAIDALTRVTQLDPALSEAHYNLALAHQAQGDGPSALSSFRTVLELTPQRVEACIGAGTVLSERGAPDEAEAYFRQAIECRPDLAVAHYSLGLALSSLQRFEEAIASYRTALGLEPDFLLAHGNLLFLLSGHDSRAQVVYAEHRAWANRHADPLGAHAQHDNTADPGRRLRVGYVSAELWDHPVGRFIEPVLEHHDREAFEVVCFQTHPRSDRVTARLRRLAQRWVECAASGDEALAALVRAERIDVLVDLSGHTARNRLLAFARRPAPVQATYLGYPTTTGLSAMGYRITDPTVDPAGFEALNAEEPVRLPHSYFCYASEDAPGVGPLPARRHGGLTFGSFNACSKWSGETLRLWARVLHAVPGSRLVLKAKDLSVEPIRRRALERLADVGIGGGRVELHGWAQTAAHHLRAYGEVDIALDTYPYNGATTTCEALWMGVPVVTLKGPTHASRMAASILAATGLHELVADTPEGYVEICAGLAADPARIEALREGLRGRLRASPLMDGRVFTKDLEHAYRDMWRAWCRGRQEDS